MAGLDISSSQSVSSDTFNRSAYVVSDIIWLTAIYKHKLKHIIMAKNNKLQ